MAASHGRSVEQSTPECARALKAASLINKRKLCLLTEDRCNNIINLGYILRYVHHGQSFCILGPKWNPCSWFRTQTNSRVALKNHSLKSNSVTWKCRTCALLYAWPTVLWESAFHEKFHEAGLPQHCRSRLFMKKFMKRDCGSRLFMKIFMKIFTGCENFHEKIHDTN